MLMNALLLRTNKGHYISMNMVDMANMYSTRPDTRQNSRGRLGRSKNPLGIQRYLRPTDERTDGRTDTARCRVVFPRLKTMRCITRVTVCWDDYWFLLPSAADAQKRRESVWPMNLSFRLASPMDVK